MVSSLNLIFLISLPRSGSTLLQNVLSAHSAVHSVSEPWLMLPFCYAGRKTGQMTAYDSYVDGGAIALGEFLGGLKERRAVYREAVRKAASHLYDTALRESGKKFFLDKTPRYHLILDELIEIFPEAHYVFLYRNPLAVFASALDVFLKGDWSQFREGGIAEDLNLGWNNIERVRGRVKFGQTVRYEALVENPEKEIRSLCEGFGIGYEPEMLEYGQRGVLKGASGDLKSVHKHGRPVKDYKEGWRRSLDTADKGWLAKTYLEHLGPTVVAKAGYDYAGLMGEMELALKGRKGVIAWERLTDPNRTKLGEVWSQFLYRGRTKGWFAAFGQFLWNGILNGEVLELVWKKVFSSGCKK